MSNSTDYLRRRAKTLKKAFLAGDPQARDRVADCLPGRETIKHADALFVVAREEGHESWPKLKLAHEIAVMDRDRRAERLKMALFFGQGWVADALLKTDPALADANLGLQIERDYRFNS